MAVNDNDTEGISLLQEVKLQAKVLVPVLEALRNELGEAKANALVADALRDWSKGVYRAIADGMEGSPREKFEQVTLAGMPRIGDDIDVEWIEQSEEKMSFNVTGCRFADFFRELGEPGLGGLLLCETDVHIGELAEGEVEFERTQTIMQGADHCDFRYRVRKDG